MNTFEDLVQCPQLRNELFVTLTQYLVESELSPWVSVPIGPWCLKHYPYKKSD